MLGHEISIAIIGLEHLNDLVACYRQVYGESDAWREFKSCSDCNRLWSIQEWAMYISERQKNGSYVDRCLCGSDHIIDYWPVNKVREVVLHEAIEHDCKISLAIFDGTNLIGFVWGYNDNVSEIESQKQIPNLASTVKHKFGSDVTHVFYQSEMGILQPYQKRGLGKLLFWIRLCLVVDAGYRVGIFRTNQDAGSYHMGIKYGYKQITSYEVHGVNSRLILGADLRESKSIFFNRENSTIHSAFSSVKLRTPLSNLMSQSDWPK